MDARRNFLNSIFLILISVMSYGCHSDDSISNHLTILFNTFENIKPVDDKNLYPAEFKEISMPFDDLTKNGDSNTYIFDAIKFKDVLNEATASLDIKNSAEGNIDMNNPIGVADQLETIFSEKYVDKSL